MQDQPQKQDASKKPIKDTQANKESEWKSYAKTFALQTLSVTAQAMLTGFAAAAGGYLFKKITEVKSEGDNVIPLRKHG